MAKILLLSTDVAFREKVKMAIPATTHEVYTPISGLEASHLLDELDADFVLYDLSYDEHQEFGLLHRLTHSYWVRTAYFTDGAEAENLQLMRQNPNVSCLIGKNSPTLVKDLEALVEKILQKKIWDFNAYLTNPKPEVILELQSYSQKQQCLDMVSDYASKLSGFPDFAYNVQCVASELIMNAFFDAPVDRATGLARYTRLARSETVSLDLNEKIIIKLSHDDQRLALSVSDSFGTLKQESVVRSLFRSQRRGEGQMKMIDEGAGVGLYMVMNLASHLVFNVHNGVKTESICLFQITKKRRNFDEQIRSLCFFLEETG